VAGPNSLNAGPTSGAIGAASPSYNPGIRNAGAAWADSSGRIWILGGEVTYSGVLSDLWVFNPTTTGGGTYPTPYAYPTPSGGGGVAKIIFRFPVRDDQWDQFDNYAPRGSLIFPQYNPNGHSELVTDLTITPGLAAHIRKTHDAGMKVLGYVGAKFNTGVVKDDATTKAEINKWYELYGMDGIYFGAGGPLDQASIDHFKRMATYIHDKGGIVVMHGDEEGGFTDQQFVTAFDVLVTNEQYVHYDDSGRLIGEFHKIGSFDDSYTFHDSVHTWMSQYPRSKFAAFANFNAVSLDVLKKAEKEFLDFGNGYIYLSNLEYDNEKNPEDLTFWRTEIDGLDGSFDGNLPR
jgi:hypothetical protein